MSYETHTHICMCVLACDVCSESFWPIFFCSDYIFLLFHAPLKYSPCDLKRTGQVIVPLLETFANVPSLEFCCCRPRLFLNCVDVMESSLECHVDF
jgi:hypothetical protein